MAQAVMIVCDTCGKPAEHTVTFRKQGSTQTRQTDRCGSHMDQLIRESRPATRGRPRNKATGAPTKKPGGRKRAARKKVAARKRTATK